MLSFEIFKIIATSKRILWWLGISALLYLLPLTYRFITRNPTVPINLEGIGDFWLFNILYIPNNLFFEKIVVNYFFPGGFGALIADEFARIRSSKKVWKFRIIGALIFFFLWTSFQYALWVQNITGPHGQNIAESPEVYPLNFILALVATTAPSLLALPKRFFLFKNFSFQNDLIQILFLTFKDLEGRKLLDVGCGTGRIARILSKKGVLVTGADTDSRVEKEFKRNTKGRFLK